MCVLLLQLHLLPLCLWEVWCGLLQSIYLRLHPRSFAAYRLGEADLAGVDLGQLQGSLRGHRLPSDQTPTPGQLKLGDLLFVEAEAPIHNIKALRDNETFIQTNTITTHAAAATATEALTPTAAAPLAIASLTTSTATVTVTGAEVADAGSVTVDAGSSSSSLLPLSPARRRPGRPRRVCVLGSAEELAGRASSHKAALEQEALRLDPDSVAGLAAQEAKHKFRLDTTLRKMHLKRLQLAQTVLQMQQRMLAAAQAEVPEAASSRLQMLSASVSAASTRVEEEHARWEVVQSQHAAKWAEVVAGWTRRRLEATWRLEKAVAPFVAAAVREDFSALAALKPTTTATATAAASSSSNATTQQAPHAHAHATRKITLRKIHMLMQSVAAMPELMRELSARVDGSGEGGLPPDTNIDQLRLRLHELHASNHNTNNKATATAAADRPQNVQVFPITYSSSGAAAASTSTTSNTSPPSYLILMTDLSTDQMRAIQQGFIELVSRRRNGEGGGEGREREAKWQRHWGWRSALSVLTIVIVVVVVVVVVLSSSFVAGRVSPSRCSRSRCVRASCG